MVKKIKVIGKDIIGFDELNNAFHLNSSFNIRFPLIVCGYLIRDYAGSSNHQYTYYTGKKKVFTRAGHSKEEVLKRSRKYISENPNFYYSTLYPREVNQDKTKIRAEAIAAITLNFILNYQLKQENVVLVLDKMDSAGFSQDVSHYCREFLAMSGLSIPIKIQENADKRNPVVKRADRIAYYIGAIKFKCGVGKWPKRERKVDLRFLIDLILKVRNPQEKTSVLEAIASEFD